jgi:CheY-like chemotaxis protein/HPt (histidine-containing phosphotransfer) domain-containing protein
LGNAVKFTSEGWIELRVDRVSGQPGVRIGVVDTGPGIPADQREHLFMEFERLDADRVDAIEGSGLGLALSARLATLMKGRLAYEANPGGGSIFWLELPLQRSLQSSIEPLSAPDEALLVMATSRGVENCATPAHVAPLRVLVVDDIAMNRDIAQSFLTLAGHEAVCAEGGAEAIAVVASQPFDVVLMDVRMPGIDGLEATRRIRAGRGLGQNVPIIGLTAQAFAEQVTACRMAGMDGHLAKPYGPKALIAAVEAAAGHGYGAVKADAAALPSQVDVAHLGESVGEALPVLDTESSNRLASFLPPDVVQSYLQSLATRAEALLLNLDRTAPLYNDEAVAEAVHALSGSAGMFGFARLTGYGRLFEQSLRMGTADKTVLGTRFRSALEATLRDIRARSNTAAASFIEA